MSCQINHWTKLWTQISHQTDFCKQSMASMPQSKKAAWHSTLLCYVMKYNATWQWYDTTQWTCIPIKTRQPLRELTDIDCMNQHVPMPMCTSPLYHVHVQFTLYWCLCTLPDPIVLFPHHTVPMGTSQFQLCNSSKHNIHLLLIGPCSYENLLSIPGLCVDIFTM